MCDQTEIEYLDEEVVWVKLGSCWWPGEVVGQEKLPSDLVNSFRKPPIAVVKFFQEDAYEYIKNINSIYKYNCRRKNEFIKKGLDMYRSKHGHMEKFPEDVIRAESITGGDTEILTRDEFQEKKKESYAGIFGDTNKRTPVTPRRGGQIGKSKYTDTPKISPNRKIKKGNTEYKVHILLQDSKPSVNTSTDSPSPSTSRADIPSTSEEPDKSVPPATLTPTPVNTSNSGLYTCHACPFTTMRLNVMIIHNKTHSFSMPYIPSPIRKKPIVKDSPKVSPKITVSVSKTPKVRRSRKDKGAENKKVSYATKRTAEDPPKSPAKKTKTDEEIKSSLLADWDDEGLEDEEPVAMVALPEIPILSQSPAVPSTADCLASTEIVGTSTKDVMKTCENLSTDKPECSSDSKYEFCEDEDWPLEADIGRKIPRVKNASKQKIDSHSRSLEDDDVAREVAELLDKTTVPDLPSAPEPLKVEENFPEPTVAKSPDKVNNESIENKVPNKPIADGTQTKTIFKTKTFFRSRHSRSQDAIGKYVAEQLNAAEKMDPLENDINGSGITPSPEERDSPPIEQVKVARLAPKIQLKKMKAEAAQMKEKLVLDTSTEDKECAQSKLLLSTEHKENVQGQINIPNSIQENVIIPKTSIENDTEILQENDRNNIDKPKVDDTQTVLEPNLADHSEYEGMLKKELCEEHLPKKQELSIECNSDENKLELKEKIDDFKSKENDIPDNNDFNKNISNILTPEVTQVLEVNLFKSHENCNETFIEQDTQYTANDADCVTKVVSTDPPEDLFEDDNKNSSISNQENGLDSLNGGFHNYAAEQSLPIEVAVENTKTKSPDKPLLQQNNIIDNDQIFIDPVPNKDVNIHSNSHIFLENMPSESDLQIAEALINLPSTHNTTTIQNTSKEDKEEFSDIEVHKENQTKKESISVEISVENKTEVNDVKTSSDVFKADSPKARYETDKEKSENLNAAQSLVQMSETLDHKLTNVTENKVNDLKTIRKVEKVDSGKFERKISTLTDANNTVTIKTTKFDTGPSKLLQILEEPCTPRVPMSKIMPAKSLIVPGKEKIINFDVNKAPIKISQPSKQKIIIRHSIPNKNTIINNLNESPENIILSRTKSSQEGSSVQTYTIQASPEVPSDGNKIIIQQKIKKLTKSPQKIQKFKQQNTFVALTKETKLITNTNEEALFDINSMPIVLSDDIITPENIEKMPIVTSDGNIINNPTRTDKLKQIINETEKVPAHNTTINKAETKSLVMNTTTPEASKSSTPNILSKSSKLRATKPMLVFDKTTGKQKIIMTKSEPPIKDVKHTSFKPTSIGLSGKSEKFILLPATNSPRSNRSQKIVIDPQTGKTHVLVAQTAEPSNLVDNKPASAKLIPSAETGTGTGTFMIITDAQGTQSKIVLTPKHEKILFPKKQQPTVTQIKTVNTQRQVVSTTNIIHKHSQPIVSNIKQPVILKPQTRIVPKQKSAIITSKGQLIVGGRLACPVTQSIAPMPEIRPAPPIKRLISSESTKTIQTIQKTTPGEPLIFFQQKSGTIMQLTTAQFEHLQRTGEILAKSQVQPVIQENKIIVQKSISIKPNEPIVPLIQKPRLKMTKPRLESPIPTKKFKQETATAYFPSVTTPPALAPISNNTISQSLIIPSNTQTSAPTSYSDLDNLEEMLPSTAIARQPELVAPALVEAPPPEPAPTAQIADGQLLAVPCEHFGGPPGSFYLCVEDKGTFNPIDNRPLVLENNQLVPMVMEPAPVIAAHPERRDILEAALANSDVFHAETPRDEAPDFRDLNANVSVHCRVSETSTTLNQPIMTPVEMPTKGETEPTVPSNLEDGLAVIGVTPQTVPTSLELPITVTDPRIAPKTTDPLSNTTYGTSLLTSPNTELTYVDTEETVCTGPISMPLLTEEDDGIGKSMPILTDEVNERTASSIESAVGSPSSIEVRESEIDDGSNWPRRLLTPGSDSSETSAEIPLQPVIQISVSDLNRDS